jgi:hypothetical protein
VQNFNKLLQEGKAWETEADAEPGEKATGGGSTRKSNSQANGEAEPVGKIAGVGSTGKANSGPAGKAAGAEKPGPAIKTVGARRYRPACKAASVERSRPVGKAAGSERSRPAGKAACADIEWHDEEGGDIADRLPEIYREWASVFSEEEINRLPDYTEYDHKIELVEGANPPFGPIYTLPGKELQSLRRVSPQGARSGGPHAIRLTREFDATSQARASPYRRQRFSQSRIGLSREASRTFSSARALRTSTARSPVKMQSIKDWAALGSVKNVLQFLGFAEKRQECLVVLGLCELLSPAKIQPTEDWAEPRSVENVQQCSSFANLY